MCLILWKPVNVPFPSNLSECARANPDGYGIMWSDNGKLHIHKALKWEERPENLLDTLIDKGVAIHFRTASVGKITLNACHPHSLNPYLALMHNGNLFHFSDDFFQQDGLTDSQRFCDFLKIKTSNPINPDVQTYAIGNAKYEKIEKYARLNYSKLLFMNAFGDVRIINEDAGMWQAGCWFSNGGIENYVGYGYSGAYPYHAGDIRHKGGVLNVRGFPDEKEWQRCGECGGWFKELKDVVCPDCEAYHELLEMKA